MSWTDDAMVTAFDAEAGAVSTLATAAQKILWWNEGQARLGYYKPITEDITWAAGDRDVALPVGFISLDKLVVDDGDIPQPWRVFGANLVLDDPTGASEAGGARLFYWGEFTEMTEATTASDLTRAQDYACLYYALSRFFKRLSSNRAYYKRYATLVGANAVTQTDLQQEADRYYQDFLDSRDDIKPLPPAFAYES
jgi:hypothetical protein